MNFSRFPAVSAITGSAERKNLLQMRHFQTISEFSHSLDPLRSLAGVGRDAGPCPRAAINLWIEDEPIRRARSVAILDLELYANTVRVAHEQGGAISPLGIVNLSRGGMLPRSVAR